MVPNRAKHLKCFIQEYGNLVKTEHSILFLVLKIQNENSFSLPVLLFCALSNTRPKSNAFSRISVYQTLLIELISEIDKRLPRNL